MPGPAVAGRARGSARPRGIQRIQHGSQGRAAKPSTRKNGRQP